MIPEITESQLSDIIVDSENVLTVVIIGAVWCSPCKAYKPILDRYRSETQTPVYYVDADANAQTLETYSVRSVPTTLCFKGGELVHSFVGAKSFKMLSNELLSHA